MSTKKTLSVLAAAILVAPLLYSGVARAEGESDAWTMPSHMTARDMEDNVNSHLRTHSELSKENISVTSNSIGDITLTGTVSSPEARDKAVEVAGRAPYVRTIDATYLEVR